MNFYEDSNGLFHINDDIYPSGGCIVKVHDNDETISVFSTDDVQLVGAMKITEIAKEDNSFYTTLDDFITSNANFF